MTKMKREKGSRSRLACKRNMQVVNTLRAKCIISIMFHALEVPV